MTNSDRGGNVIREVLVTLAAAYGWPAFKPVERGRVELLPESDSKGDSHEESVLRASWTAEAERASLHGSPS